jgi:hypothetical protein
MVCAAPAAPAAPTARYATPPRMRNENDLGRCPWAPGRPARPDDRTTIIGVPRRIIFGGDNGMNGNPTNQLGLPAN